MKAGRKIRLRRRLTTGQAGAQQCCAPTNACLEARVLRSCLRRGWCVAVLALAMLAGVGIALAQSSPSAKGGYRIAGVAVDAVSGQPLGRAEISIESQEDKKVHEAYATGNDGRFSFEGLTAGRYTLLAGRRGYVKQAYKGHDRYSTAIVVGQGLATDQIRFAMTQGGSIAGQVVDERGDVVRNARVLLLRASTTEKTGS